jgi:hypothetical protein
MLPVAIYRSPWYLYVLCYHSATLDYQCDPLYPFLSGCRYLLTTGYCPPITTKQTKHVTSGTLNQPLTYYTTSTAIPTTEPSVRTPQSNLSINVRLASPGRSGQPSMYHNDHLSDARSSPSSSVSSPSVSATFGNRYAGITASSNSTQLLPPPPPLIPFSSSSSSPSASSSRYHLPTYNWSSGVAEASGANGQSPHSPYTSAAANVSPSVNTSAFFYPRGDPMPIQALGDNAGNHVPFEGYQHQQANVLANSGNTDYSGNACEDTMLHGASSSPMAFTGLSLEHPATGLGLDGISTAGSQSALSSFNQYEQAFSDMMKPTWQAAQGSLLFSNLNPAMLSPMSSHSNNSHLHYDQPNPSIDMSQLYPIPQPFRLSHDITPQDTHSRPTPRQQQHIPDVPPHSQPTYQMSSQDISRVTSDPTAFNTPLHLPAPPILSAPPVYTQTSDSRPLFPIAGTTIDPPTAFHIQSYLSSPNRIAVGERKLVIHTPRVGQKSYGTEKRYVLRPYYANTSGRLVLIRVLFGS